MINWDVSAAELPLLAIRHNPKTYQITCGDDCLAIKGVSMVPGLAVRDLTFGSRTRRMLWHGTLYAVEEMELR